jgi:hypothetical protein
MEELIFALKQLPKPLVAWTKIERELLNDSEATRHLGSITMLAGAIMESVPESDRSDYLAEIKQAAEIAWSFYETLYQGNPAVFNDHRLAVRASIRGWLASPHTGRPPSSDSMLKKSKAWSMPDEDWKWLESQDNQSETLRQAIAFYRQQSE